MTPATLSVPWSNSNSLPPHSQISEASPSCELTRWSGMGGSDLKDPSLTHPLLLSPCFLLKCHLPAIHSDWGKCRTKPMSLVLRAWGSYLFMEILFGFCTGGSFNKAVKAQTLKGCHPGLTNTRARKSWGALVKACVGTGKNGCGWHTDSINTSLLTLKSLPTGSHAH